MTSSPRPTQAAVPARANAGLLESERASGGGTVRCAGVLSPEIHLPRAEMPVKAIHAQVEGMLGGRVSRYSVSDYLRTRSKEPRPLFIRTRHGHYQLIRQGQSAGQPR